MKMNIPCIQKISYRNNVYIERSLLTEGVIKVSVGQEVKPYTVLGQSSDLSLISGVWGKVEDVVENSSVLISSFAIDLHLVVSSSSYAEGELIVFPNPSDLIQKQYLEKFAYSLKAKLIYIGNTVSLELIQLAKKYGVSGIIAGGCTRATFDFAQKEGFFLGLFSGFGLCKTPEVIFDVLSDVSTRIVFASGDDRCVRIPMPAGFSGMDAPLSESIFKPLEPGLKVLVLQNPYFGSVGSVSQVDESNPSRVVVKLSSFGDGVEVNVPNLLAL